MTENEMMNGWTFEETIKTAENLMEEENNIFKWDVLRHLRDFAEHYKEQLEQYRTIGTVEEIEETIKNLNKVLLEHKDKLAPYVNIGTIEEFKALKEKSEPKKVVYKDHANCCPACDYHYDKSGREWIGKNCPNCGQAILRT